MNISTQPHIARPVKGSKRIVILDALRGFALMGIALANYPWGDMTHDLLYTLSVYPMGLAYMSGLCLLYLRFDSWPCWRLLAYPGRMALTCYISQSVIGLFLFYGIGLGWGTSVGLWQTELVSLAVYAVEILLCAAWLRFFNFGPLEWLWRMLTYGIWFPLRKKATER